MRKRLLVLVLASLLLPAAPIAARPLWLWGDCGGPEVAVSTTAWTGEEEAERVLRRLSPGGGRIALPRGDRAVPIRPGAILRVVGPAGTERRPVAGVALAPGATTVRLEATFAPLKGASACLAVAGGRIDPAARLGRPETGGLSAPLVRAVRDGLLAGTSTTEGRRLATVVPLDDGTVRLYRARFPRGSRIAWFAAVSAPEPGTSPDDPERAGMSALLLLDDAGRVVHRVRGPLPAPERWEEPWVADLDGDGVDEWIVRETGYEFSWRFLVRIGRKGARMETIEIDGT